MSKEHRIVLIKTIGLVFVSIWWHFLCQKNCTFCFDFMTFLFITKEHRTVLFENIINLTFVGKQNLLFWILFVQILCINWCSSGKTTKNSNKSLNHLNVDYWWWWGYVYMTLFQANLKYSVDVPRNGE